MGTWRWCVCVCVGGAEEDRMCVFTCCSPVWVCFYCCLLSVFVCSTCEHEHPAVMSSVWCVDAHIRLMTTHSYQDDEGDHPIHTLTHSKKGRGREVGEWGVETNRKHVFMFCEICQVYFNHVKQVLCLLCDCTELVYCD